MLLISSYLWEALWFDKYSYIKLITLRNTAICTYTNISTTCVRSHFIFTVTSGGHRARDHCSGPLDVLLQDAETFSSRVCGYKTRCSNIFSCVLWTRCFWRDVWTCVWRHNQTSQRDVGNINISSQSCAEAEPGVFHGSSEHFLDVFVVFLQTVNQSINTELYIIYSSCVTLTPPARVVMVEAVQLRWMLSVYNTDNEGAVHSNLKLTLIRLTLMNNIQYST